jgi:hypothetical protein
MTKNLILKKMKKEIKHYFEYKFQYHIKIMNLIKKIF